MEECTNDMTNDEFIEFVKKQNRFRIIKNPPEPAPEPKNVADGLREWVQSMAGRPFPEISTEDEDDLDLQAWWDKNIDEYEKNYDYEKEWQELLEEFARTPMYDFGTGKMSNEKDMGDFYGAKIVSRIQKEIRESYEMPDKKREDGHVSKELWQELKDIRAGKKPQSDSASRKGSAGNQYSDTRINDKKRPTKKPKEQKSNEINVVQRERRNGDDYFLTTERGIIRNETYRELFKGPGVVYEWLWANLVRSEWIDTKGYPIKEKYYDKGYLACCCSYRHIAKKCRIHKNKVKEYMDNFERAGIIKVGHLVPEGKKRGQSVFILGTWKMENGKRVERYFRDEVFLSAKDGQNMPN
jgi:hypothetical protein